MTKRIDAYKICDNCGANYGRARFPSGRLELMSQFKKRRFCSHLCAVRKTADERRIPFWNRVDKSGGENKCWPWRGAQTSFGYGNFGANGKTITASRHAYELTKGPIPKGIGYHGTVVMHSCDNPACCNPSHLFIGSQKDNNDDRDKKGRGWWQK